jgi:predicted enzyme related to lactoylglutathione lyase
MSSARICCLPGSPCWVSLMARDIEAAKSFYGPLLGWSFEPAPDRWGPYVRAFVEGTEVAGIGAVARDWETAVNWTTYFGVESADAVAAEIRERGGTVAVGPLDFDAGRLALAADSAGAAFGIWEGDRRDSPRSRGHGAPVWIELRTRDAFASALFYGQIFAWDKRDPLRYEVVWEHERVVLRVDGHSVAGVSGGGVEAAADPRIRPRWHVYFSVPDVDEAVEHARSLGAEVTGEPTEGYYGRVAGLRDPEGALLSLVSHHA